MKIPAAFKPKELLTVFAALLILTVLVMGFAPTALFKTALFIFIPFLFLAIWFSIKYAHKKIVVSEAQKNNPFFLSVKIISIFLMLLLCYFAFGHGLLLYQSASYDAQMQPMWVQFANDAQLLWALKLTVSTWIIAASLMVAMIALDKNRISEFSLKKISSSRYGLVIDSIVAISFALSLSLLITLTSVEFSRVVLTLAGLQWPIYPEVTAFILILTLFVGYRLFHLKQRVHDLAKKSISVGRLLAVQTFYLISLLLLGQAIIAFFPQQMILPLTKPILNLVPNLSYESVWLLLTITLAITSAPVIARLFARILVGLTLGKAALILTVPLLMSSVLLSVMRFKWLPQADLIPITLDNVVYQVGPAQYILIGALILLLACLTTSTALQKAWVDIMPLHFKQRIRRLCFLLADQIWILMVMTSIYLVFASLGYYFMIGIYFVPFTFILLWVGLYLFYTLTQYRKKVG